MMHHLDAKLNRLVQFFGLGGRHCLAEGYDEEDAGDTFGECPIRRRRTVRTSKTTASTGNTKMLKIASQIATAASHPAKTSAASQASYTVRPKSNPDWVWGVGAGCSVGWSVSVTV